MESLKHEGIWWLPSKLDTNDERQFYGTLTFQPRSGGLLELVGEFGSFELRAKEEPENFEIIQGLVQGALVTLLNCETVGFSGSYPGFETTKLKVSFIFMGHHFDSIDDIRFDRVSLSYTYMDEWMRRKNFERVGKYDVRYVPFETIESLFDNFKLAFSYSYNRNMQLAKFSTTVSIEDKARVSIIPQTNIGWADFFQFFNSHLPNFLSLATGYSNYAIDVKGTLSSTTRKVDICYQIPHFDEQPEPMTNLAMLFTFDDVKDDVSDYLAAWIDKFEDLGSVVDLYFHTVHSKALNQRTRFLLLAQALEAYHRNRNPEEGFYVTPVEDYKPIERALITALEKQHLDTSHTAKLKSSIEFGNEYSLRKRIKEVIDEITADHGEIAEALRDIFGKSRVFASEITKTRNYLTHHPKTAPKNALAGLSHIKKMQFLLRLCFLKELGFPIDSIQLLQPDYRWKLKL